jgi:polyhydroxybutyrate depolymerase
MRCVVAGSLLFGLLFASACHRAPNLAPGTVARTLAFGGAERTYTVHAGQGPAAKKGLVLLLHGSGGNGASFERRTHFDEVADRAGFVAVYPNAVGGRWNDGWETSATDDVGFLAALAGSLLSEYRIDPDRVYAAGISNGASMAHRLACERGTVAAIAAVAGAMPASVRAACATGRPVSVLEMHGTDDPWVPYDDDLTATVTTWVTRDACHPAEPTLLPDVDPTDGTRVRLQGYACPEGVSVAFYTIEGGGHAWPGGKPLASHKAGRTSRDIDASAAVWDFFSTRSRIGP